MKERAAMSSGKQTAAGIERMRSPRRLEQLQVERVLESSLEGSRLSHGCAGAHVCVDLAC